MNKLALGCIAIFTATATQLAIGADGKLPPPADKKDVTYAKDIQPIFKASCFGCHGAERQKGNLRLDSLEAALKGSKEGKVILPSNSEKSKLVIAVARINPREAMPPEPRKGRGPGGPAGGPPPNGGGPDGPHRDGPGGFGGGPGAPSGPPAKPLTAEEVGLIRAWIDQGAK